MAKKVKKAATRENLQKGVSLYNPALEGRVREIIIDIQTIRPNGKLHYGQIAKIMDIPTSTFSRWKDPESEYYKPAFVIAMNEALKELHEIIDTGKIKRAMVLRAAGGAIKTKVTKELQMTGPKLPKFSDMKKADLVESCREFGITVKSKMTVDELKTAIRDHVEENTSEQLVVVKVEEEKLLGDVSAAKFVLPNIGPKEERWGVKTELDVQGESIADFAAMMYGKKKVG